MFTKWLKSALTQKFYAKNYVFIKKLHLKYLQILFSVYFLKRLSIYIITLRLGAKHSFLAQSFGNGAKKQVKRVYQS